MSMPEIVQFSVLAFLGLVTVGSAIMVASTRGVIHAAFWLFPVFAGVAGFYLLMGAQFLAAIQVLIYIGAILVLIIFAVTLTRNAASGDGPQTNRYYIPVAGAALALLAALGGAFFQAHLPAARASIDGVAVAPGAPVSDVSAIGLVLMHQYLLPFEIASVLLLAAMIGAVVLARKERPATQSEAEKAPSAQPPVGVK